MPLVAGGGGGGWFWNLQSLTLISLLPACDVKCDLPDFCSNGYACLLSYFPTVVVMDAYLSNTQSPK